MSAIVDTCCSLTDARSYKPAFPAEKAFAMLENMDPATDQNMLAVFMKNLLFDANRREGEVAL